MKTKKERKRCYNCKYASEPFKVIGKTHHHCLLPELDEGVRKGTLTAWDTLRVFYDDCDQYEVKPPKQETQE